MRRVWFGSNWGGKAQGERAFAYGAIYVPLGRDSGSPIFRKTTRAGRPQPKSLGCGIGILPMGLDLYGRDARAPCPNHKLAPPP